MSVFMIKCIEESYHKRNLKGESAFYETDKKAIQFHLMVLTHNFHYKYKHIILKI